jgi:AbrB family looped-hinge helix DNA binding protein
MPSMEIVRIDKSGRLVIPERIRKKLEIKEHTDLLIADVKDGAIIIIKKLDEDEIAKRLREELKGVDLEAFEKSVERESGKKARKEASKILSRH